MKWFELEVGYSDGPRMVDLALRLKNPLAEAYVTRLWAYCYEHELYRLTGLAAVATIEQAARWRGKTGALVAVLLETGHLERDGEGFIVHGVQKRLEAAQARRGDSAERQRRYRERKVSGNASVTRGVTRDVTRESHAHHTTPHQEPPVVPLEQPDRWEPLLAAMTHEQRSAFDAEKASVFAEVRASNAWTSVQNTKLLEAEERMFAEWSARLEPARAAAGGA